MWLYVSLKIVANDIDATPNDIIFSVNYANGESCDKSFLAIPTDLIGTGTVTDLEVGKNLDGFLGGLESWRRWRTWAHTGAKSCHAACMPNWCLEDNDDTACFPSGIYVLDSKSTQEGNKFTMYISRDLDSSTVVSTCGDILTSSPNLGTDSACSYQQTPLTLTIYVGNSHSVSGTSKLCIDPTLAAPAGVLTATDLNCMDVEIDLPTVSITAPTEGEKFSYRDPITISTSTANLTNVGSYTFVFETVSGPTSYNGFSGANESSKIISGDSLVPGTYVFKVYLNIGDSGNFAPNDTVTVEILTNLTSTSQLGNRFYFTFDHSLPNAVSDCSLVNVGLGLLGTTPICTSTTNVLTIESNLTDGSYVATNTIGLSDILTTHTESLTVDHAPPSLSPSISPNNPEWDAGVDGNQWDVVLINGADLTIDQWLWTKISGPAISFASNLSTQSYLSQTLVLGGSYVISLTLNFSNAPWLSLTHQFNTQKINFNVVSNTQSGENFTIVLSDSRVSISSCADIFDAGTITKLGASATCVYNVGTKTLQVNASADHTLSAGDSLIYSNADLMSTTSSYTVIELGIYVNTGSSSQEGNKFILKLSMEFDPSTVISTCSDILTASPNLGTDSACSYNQPALTLTLYVGNGHAVTNTDIICIDPTKALPVNVVTTTDLNCMDVEIDLPTVSITAPTEGEKFSYRDPITISTSTANLTNVGSYTFVFETVSGPTSYNGFSGANESSKIISGDSLVPGTYVFKVYLNIGDSGNFAPNDTVTVEILTNLTSTSQLGNRFYFTFDHSLPNAVSDCSLVNVGLGLLGTTPICTSTTNVLTIESNLTDGSYVATNTIGLSDILTTHTESLTVDHAPPSLSPSISPNNPEWDAGVDGNQWDVVLINGADLTIDQWLWTKISGPAISFASNLSTQSYLSQTLVLGGSYVISLTLNFSNAPWLSLTHQFNTQKINFNVDSNTQSESKLTIILSDSRVVINSCGDIFSTTTVSNLGTNPSCTFTVKTLTVYISGDHNNLISGSNLEYLNEDLMSGTPDFALTQNLPSATLSVNGSSWTWDSAIEYVLTINTADTNSIIPAQIAYLFTYISGPYTTFTFPNIVDNVATIPALTLSPGSYDMQISLIIHDYNDYTVILPQTFVAKGTKTDLVNHGPKFTLTLNTHWPDIISSCADFFDSGSIVVLKSESVCVRDPTNKEILHVYASNSSTIAGGDSLTLDPTYYINNTMTASDTMPLFSSMTLSDPTKHWHRDQTQNITAIIANWAGLETYFNITSIFMLNGPSEVNTTGDSAGLGIFFPLRIPTAGTYTLTGMLSFADTWGSVEYFQTITDILIALPPYPFARGMNASYPTAMVINLTSDSTLDKDTGTKSENLTYNWEIFTDDLLTIPYAPWVVNTSDNTLIPANYFPLGLYYAKLTITKWIYYSSWTKGVLNITNCNTKLEISSPNLADLKADFANTFEAATLSMDGSTDFDIDWEITPAVYNRYQQGGFLTIPPETFIPGGVYELRCKITADSNRRALIDATPEIAIFMEVAKTIDVGALLITPMTGDGLTTDFSLDANTWSDPSGQILKYRFSYKIIGTTSENWFRGWELGNTVPAIKIPQGKDVFYNTVEIQVQAKNEDNSTALIRKNITVKPIVIADKSTFVDSFLSTATTPAEKLAAISSTAFLVEEDVNYAKPDACGGCDPDHGTCNSETQLCTCQEGFKLASLCNIADSEKNKIEEVAEMLATCKLLPDIYIYIYIYSTNRELRDSVNKFRRCISSFQHSK